MHEELLKQIINVQEKDINNLDGLIQWAKGINLWKQDVDQILIDLKKHGHPHNHPYQKPLSEIVMK